MITLHAMARRRWKFPSDLARKYDLFFAPGLIGSLMRSPTKKSDSIHFNQAGYAEGLHELLTDHGGFE